jgi:hypothetical protein
MPLPATIGLDGNPLRLVVEANVEVEVPDLDAVAKKADGKLGVFGPEQ